MSAAAECRALYSSGHKVEVFQSSVRYFASNIDRPIEEHLNKPTCLAQESWLLRMVFETKPGLNRPKTGHSE